MLKKPQAKAPWCRDMKIEKKKHARVKIVSAARAVDLKAYYKRLPSWKKENPICRVEYCAMPTKDCHHKRGKIHKLLLDERFWIPLCRHHHDKVKTDPTWARAEDILCQPGEWNKIQ